MSSSSSYFRKFAQDNAGNALANQIDSSTQYYKAHLEYETAEDNLVTNGIFATNTDWNLNSNANPKKLWTHFILCSPPICVLIAYHLTKSGLLPEIPPLISVLSRTTN